MAGALSAPADDLGRCRPCRPADRVGQGLVRLDTGNCETAPHHHQFEVLPRRGVVERTFAWLGRCRQLSKDYEALYATTEAWINIAMIQLMLRRLAPA